MAFELCMRLLFYFKKFVNGRIKRQCKSVCEREYVMAALTSNARDILTPKSNPNSKSNSNHTNTYT
jgi:hypothetical protein